jgi:hypothetical protein
MGVTLSLSAHASRVSAWHDHKNSLTVMCCVVLLASARDSSAHVRGWPAPNASLHLPQCHTAAEHPIGSLEGDQHCPVLHPKHLEQVESMLKRSVSQSVSLSSSFIYAQEGEPERIGGQVALEYCHPVFELEETVQRLRASSHFREILRNFEGPRDFCGVWSARRAARTPQRECMTLVRITLCARTATFAQHSPSLAPTHTHTTRIPTVT